MISQLDQELFLFINQKFTNTFFDIFFPFFTNLFYQKWMAGGVVPLLLIFWIYKKRKQALKQILVLLIMIGVTDGLCYYGIKSFYKKPRPNHITELNSEVRVPYGPKSPSFPSNHMANTTALVSFLSWVFPQGTIFYWIYAFLMGYSRVYVGVHFPIDVIGGAFIGWGVFEIIKRIVRKLNFL